MRVATIGLLAGVWCGLSAGCAGTATTPTNEFDGQASGGGDAASDSAGQSSSGSGGSSSGSGGSSSGGGSSGGSGSPADAGRG